MMLSGKKGKAGQSEKWENDDISCQNYKKPVSCCDSNVSTECHLFSYSSP